MDNTLTIQEVRAKRAEYAREWRKKNKEKHREYIKTYREKNREKVLQYVFNIITPTLDIIYFYSMEN